MINYGNTVIKSNLSLIQKGELTNNPGPGEGLYIYGTTMATLKGSGFSHEATKYHFTDQQPLTGMNFYRLKATDLDGKVAYHKVISVWVDEVTVSHVTLYPNPLRDSHELFIAATSTQTLQVTVADFFGNIIINTSVSGGKHIITLPDNIKPGSYLVSVTLKDGLQQHIRLIIQ